MAEGFLARIATDEVVEVAPVPPLPMCVGGTREQWDEYHRLHGIFFYGSIFVPAAPQSSLGLEKQYRVMTPEQRNKIADDFIWNPPVSQYRKTWRADH